MDEQAGLGLVEIERLHELRAQEELLLRFGRDEKEVLQAIYRLLFDLPHEKKRRLHQGVLAGPIVVRPFEEQYLRNHEIPFIGSEGPASVEPWEKAVDRAVTFNSAILKRDTGFK